MPVPVVLGVRVGTKGAQLPGDGDQSVEPRRVATAHARVAGVEQRLPLLRSAGLRGEFGMRLQARAHRCGVAEHDRGVQRRRRDARDAGRGCARRGRTRRPWRSGRTRPSRRRTSTCAPRPPRAWHSTTRTRARARSTDCASCRARSVTGHWAGGLCAKAGRMVKRRTAAASPSRAARRSDFAWVLSCSRFGRSGSGRGIVRPPCLLLRFASRRHGGVRPSFEAPMTVGLALRANPQAPFVRRTHRIGSASEPESTRTRRRYPGPTFGVC